MAFLISVSGNPRLPQTVMVLRPTAVSLSNCPRVSLWQWWAAKLKRVTRSAFSCIHKKPAVLLLCGEWVQPLPKTGNEAVMGETLTNSLPPQRLSHLPTLLTCQLLQEATCLLYPQQLTCRGPPPWQCFFKAHTIWNASFPLWFIYCLLPAEL